MIHLLALALAAAPADDVAAVDQHLAAYRLCDAAHRARPGLQRTSTTWSACTGVALEAQAQGLAGADVVQLVAMASHESDFRPRRGSSGEIGPLQALPRYWCPGGRAAGCDATAAGVRAYRRYLRYARGDRGLTAALYNGGYRRPSWGYADRVARRVRGLRRALRAGGAS